MTRLQLLRLAQSEVLRKQLERETQAATAVHTCTRCASPVDPADLCPGRAWCKPCENARRRRCWHAAKAKAVPA